MISPNLYGMTLRISWYTKIELAKSNKPEQLYLLQMLSCKYIGYRL